MDSSSGDRERKLSTGLRRLEEFRRQREQEQSGSSNQTHPALAAESVFSADGRPIAAASPRSHQTLRSSQHYNSPSSASSSVSGEPLQVTDLRSATVGARTQQLVERFLAAASAGALCDATLIADIQKHCLSLARDACQASNELEALRTAHEQAACTINLLVAEKSSQQGIINKLEEQLRSTRRDIDARDAKLAALRDGFASDSAKQSSSSACESNGSLNRMQANGGTNIRSTTSHSKVGDVIGRSSTKDEQTILRLQELLKDREEEHRQLLERVAELQRVNEAKSAAFNAVRSELDVAQAYMRQLSGASGGVLHPDKDHCDLAHSRGAEDSTNFHYVDMAAFAEVEKALRQVQEDLQSERRQRSSSDLLCRNLEVVNRGLQARIGELESNHNIPRSDKECQTSTLGCDAVCQCDIISSPVDTSALKDNSSSTTLIDERSHQLQVQLSDLQKKIDEERSRWKNESMELRSQCADAANELQRAKVDSSRAVSQNRQLKSQLEELQDVFVKLSNDKLELTESVQHEKHKVLQLGKQISQLEREYEDLLDIFSRYVRSQQQSPGAPVTLPLPTSGSAEGYLAEITNAVSNVGLIKDSLKESEYEIVESSSLNRAQTSCSSTEATSAAEPRVKKTAAIASLQGMDLASVVPGSAESSTQGNDPVESIMDYELSTASDNSSTTSNSATNQGSSTVATKLQSGTAQQNENLKSLLAAAVKRNEELLEEKKQLEYRVEQLRMETETISDYVQLYQRQRAALIERRREFYAQMDLQQKERKKWQKVLLELQLFITKSFGGVSHDSAGKEPTPLAPLSCTDKNGVLDSTSCVKATDMISGILDDLKKYCESDSCGGEALVSCSSCQGCYGRVLML